MIRGEQPSQEELESKLSDLEVEIDALEFEIMTKRTELLEKRKQVFVLRSMLKDTCPWCGERGCPDKDGACLPEGGEL